MIEQVKEEEVVVPIIGKYKPKRRFLNFVSGRKGGVRVLSDFAFLKSKQLSGMIDDVIFKITICDEGTINFDEMDTNLCNDEMIQRFVDYIDDLDVTGYMEKYIIPSLDFLNADDKRVYLEVETQKPIDKLFSLFDELKPQNTMNEDDMKVSDNGLSLLDNLFGDDNETKDTVTPTVGETLETKSEDIIEEKQETYAEQMMRESFEKMSNEKISELTERISKSKKDIHKYKLDIKQAESNLKTSIDDAKVLQTRLDTLKPNDPLNGYVFYVSPENKTGIEADPTTVEVIKKISPLLRLKEDAVIDILTKGFYTIKIAEKSDINKTDVPKEIYNKLIDVVDVDAKISVISANEIEYRGDMTWHQLVGKMIKMGFEQYPDFDKLCGSPSYQSEEEPKSEFTMLDSNEKVLKSNIESNDIVIKADNTIK